MTGYWSKRFAQEGMIWGSEPSRSAAWAKRKFQEVGVSTVLVPGAGYGRSTKVFSADFTVYGVELSESALEPGTFEYKEDKYAHFFSDADLREHFAGTEILETGSFTESLQSPQGGTHEYILRTILALKR